MVCRCRKEKSIKQCTRELRLNLTCINYRLIHFKMHQQNQSEKKEKTIGKNIKKNGALNWHASDSDANDKTNDQWEKVKLSSIIISKKSSDTEKDANLNCQKYLRRRPSFTASPAVISCSRGGNSTPSNITSISYPFQIIIINIIETWQAPSDNVINQHWVSSRAREIMADDYDI